MPDLVHSLQNRDIGHLRIVAGLWGVELKSAELDEALKELAAALLDPALVREVVEALPADARTRPAGVWLRRKAGFPGWFLPAVSARSARSAPPAVTVNRSISARSPRPRRFSTGLSWRGPSSILPMVCRNSPISPKI